MGYKLVQYGRKRERRDYSRVKMNIDLPNLIDVQTSSFEWFVTEGLQELFVDISPIENFTGDLELYFSGFEFSDEKYTIRQAKDKELTFSKPLYVNVKLVNNQTGEIQERKIFMGDFPFMTERASFVINGSERVIVSQIVRSAGVFYSVEIDKKTLSRRYLGQIIPNRGAWLEFETDAKNVLYVKLDRSKKIPLTTLLRAINLNDSGVVRELFTASDSLDLTYDKDTTHSPQEAILEVYSK